MQGQAEAWSAQGRVTVALVARVAHRLQALRQRERVTVVAAHRRAVTACGGIPRRLSPLDAGAVAHDRFPSADRRSDGKSTCASLKTATCRRLHERQRALGV